MSAVIARLVKPFLRLLPLTRRRRRRTTPEERLTTMPPAVLGVGIGSLGFPYEESNR
ncbi:hypothetical protein [Streptomyces sp. SD31]|uniref:hypothetical protein n=1 Tax=Streptomyces sp. SD31 TaxID=3452208 RepID=UPI003F890E2F